MYVNRFIQTLRSSWVTPFYEKCNFIFKVVIISDDYLSSSAVNSLASHGVFLTFIKKTEPPGRNHIVYSR